MDKLIEWYRTNGRSLPWRETKDPYKIWLSEILLQQTRVDQGLPYYLRFIDTFPTVHDLAKADVDQVLLLWQGLGYYTRARNLHLTAKNIVANYNGLFPESFKELLILKGIGGYTAAAIASIAFNKPHAVLDGNVFRVLARYCNLSIAINSTKGKKLFENLADEYLDKKNPGEHNEAIMELGATICTPKTPSCASCPINVNCQAFLNGNQKELPVKIGKTKQRKRYFLFLVFHYEDNYYLQKRGDQDIWRGLYQFPLIELSKKPLKTEIVKQVSMYLSSNGLLKEYVIDQISTEFKHILSHQQIHARFVHIKTEKKPFMTDLHEVFKSAISGYALPRLITRYLEEAETR